MEADSSSSDDEMSLADMKKKLKKEATKSKKKKPASAKKKRRNPLHLAKSVAEASPPRQVRRSGKRQVTSQILKYGQKRRHRYSWDHRYKYIQR